MLPLEYQYFAVIFFTTILPYLSKLEKIHFFPEKNAMFLVSVFIDVFLYAQDYALKFLKIINSLKAIINVCFCSPSSKLWRIVEKASCHPTHREFVFGVRNKKSIH